MTAAKERRRGRVITIAAIVIVLGCYFFVWAWARMLHYEIVVEETSAMVDRVLVNGVDVQVSAHSKPGTRRSYPIFSPIPRRLDRLGPHSFWLRLVDLAGTADRGFIHSASLELPDGSTTELFFVRDHEKNPAMGVWLLFNEFDGGSTIIHTYTTDRFDLPADFEVRVDVSIERKSIVERETVVIHVHLARRTRLGGGYFHPV